MTRYMTAPAAEWSDDRVCNTIAHPIVITGPPVYTGLLDLHGRRIYRVPDEIGFLPRRDVARRSKV